MNEERRKRIAEVMKKLDDLDQELVSIVEEEQQALENLPDSLQDSEQGQWREYCISEIEEAGSFINCCYASLENIIEDQ